MEIQGNSSCNKEEEQEEENEANTTENPLGIDIHKVKGKLGKAG